MEKQRNKIANKVLGGNKFRPYDKESKNVHVGADYIYAQYHRDIITYHGITLIALVITIIILLILAGITINLTLGEHGIIKMAEKAGKNYVNSAEEEQKKLGDLLNEADNIINGTGNSSNLVTPPPTYPTTAEVGGTTHTAKQIQYTWEELSVLAKVISDNYGTGNGQINNDTAEINVSINGKADTLGIGDWIRVNGLRVRILGFNHDELADQAIYGGTNTYAGISFEFAECITTAKINNSNTNITGWKGCILVATLNTTILEALENKTYIKEVNKQYIEIYNDLDSVKTTQDKLWLLSCSEIWNNGIDGQLYGYAIAKEGEQYKYYKNINANASNPNSSLIKTNNNSANTWWLRSPPYNYGTSFCNVYADGSCGCYYAGNVDNVAPSFAI